MRWEQDYVVQAAQQQFQLVVMLMLENDVKEDRFTT